MKVYIQVDENEIPRSKNFAYAYYGFHEMGFEIRYFKRVTEIIDNEPEDVIVGFVDEVRYMLQKLNCDATEVDYPDEIQKYLGRKIWKSTVNRINNDPSLWPVFMKPIESKLFTGVVVRSTHDLIGCGAKPNAECYCSEIVNFVSEWRVFVRYGKILDVKHYLGDWKLHYDANIIEACLNDYESQPAGFTMDFGLTDDGRTLLIEVNDGYSIGCYGLDPIDYAKLLSARWAELTKTEDECDFMHDKIVWGSTKDISNEETKYIKKSS
ncbi:MAG: ATP-grasp domain-containing protein [Acholeplasmatales bacterium]|nr:ATP-grasp domain-containing protein [Acholeplasmatales bacterium]